MYRVLTSPPEKLATIASGSVMEGKMFPEEVRPCHLEVSVRLRLEPHLMFVALVSSLYQADAP